MTELLLAALVTCSTGQATCTAVETETYTQINVCDISPEITGQQQFEVLFDGDLLVVTLKARCSDA